MYVYVYIHMYICLLHMHIYIHIDVAISFIICLYLFKSLIYFLQRYTVAKLRISISSYVFSLYTSGNKATMAKLSYSHLLATQLTYIVLKYDGHRLIVTMYSVCSTAFVLPMEPTVDFFTTTIAQISLFLNIS